MTCIVHIHEDDEGMRSLYPASTFEAAAEDMRQAEAAAKNNAAPCGGWTEVHMISQPDIDFSSVGLMRADADSLMAQYLPRVTRFDVGHGDNNPFRYSEKQPLAFGYGNGIYVKFECDAERVKHIWFDVVDASTDQLEQLKQAFVALDKVCPAMVADYWGNCVGLLSDQKFTSAYFDWSGEQNAS